MPAIPDPTLYGPPTVFQAMREQLARLREEVVQSYQRAGESDVALLKKYPDDQGAHERLKELHLAARRHLDAISRPYIKILAMEPMATMWVVRSDGTLEVIDERVPMMSAP